MIGWAMKSRRAESQKKQSRAVLDRILKETANLLLQGHRVAVPMKEFSSQDEVHAFVVSLSKLTEYNVRGSSGPADGFVVFYNDDGTDGSSVSMMRIKT